MNGLLFPGQGSQAVGMGKNLYLKLPQAKEILDEANDLLGFNLKALMFGGPIETLTDTKFSQIAIYTCSAMYLEKIKAAGIEYNYVAGHSLGEYSALLAAGVYSFAQGLHLVAQRGKAMSLMNGKGAMAAVLGLDAAELAKYMDPDVVMANLNSKTQIVISGTEAGIEKTEKNLDSQKAVRFKRLRVSAAFHSPQMNSIIKTMESLIEKTPFCTPSCYVIPNVTAVPTQNVEEIKKNLIAQITGQVRWYESILAMKEAGVEMLYEVGNGDVLKQLNKTITFRPRCIGMEI